MRGFTLLEMMIVVALIGALATLGGIHIVRSLEEGRIQTATIKCKEVHDKVTLWMLLSGAKEPPAEVVAVTRPVREGGGNFGTIEPDPWGSPYRIEQEGGRRFRIWCDGPDGESGTDDDIAYEPVET